MSLTAIQNKYKAKAYENMIDEGWINHFSFPHDGKEVKNIKSLYQENRISFIISSTKRKTLFGHFFYLTAIAPFEGTETNF